jgi:hypothetical protein
MDRVNERRRILLNIARAGGRDMYGVRLNSGL